MSKLAFFVCLSLLLSTPVRAQDAAAKAAAQSLLRQGNRELDRGRFQVALEKYLKAYQRFPSAKLFLNQGNALRGLGRDLDALLAYQRFLAEASDVPPVLQAEASKHVQELTAKVGRLEIRSNRTEALVRLGEQEKGVTPLPGPVFVEPREHQITLEWLGEKKSKTVLAKAGESTMVEVDFPVRPGQLVLRSNRDGATMQVDGNPAGQSPLADPLSLAPGEHDVVLEWHGEKKTAHIALAEGQAAALDLTFAEPIPVPAALTEPVKPPPPPPTAWYRKPWVWIAAGAVVVAVGTTLVLLYAHSDQYPDPNLGKQPIGN